MFELISIREASRRIGVSDTAVRKAIASGRVKLASPQGDPPLLSWPECGEDWKNNSNAMKRSHVGGNGNHDQPAPGQRIQLGISGDGGAPKRPPAGGVPDDVMNPNDNDAEAYSKARAKKEAYNAALAELEFQQKSGKLIDAEEAANAWTKLVISAKTRILGIPAICKSRVSDLPLAVVAVIEQACRDALEDLSKEQDFEDV